MPIGSEMSDREFFIQYAWAYIGTWYKWGGDDPAGFDCSGLSSEDLQAVGVLANKERLTAHGTYLRLKHLAIPAPKTGCLVLYLNDAMHATHIEICIRGSEGPGPALAIGAKGGGPNTLTMADAIRDNAFIKVRPIFGRTGGTPNPHIVFLDPFAEGEDPQ